MLIEITSSFVKMVLQRKTFYAVAKKFIENIIKIVKKTRI